MSDPIVEKIVVARIGLLIRHPFFGNLATRMKLIDASDWCATAATDFRNLYYNRDFFAAMSEKEIEFVVGHEILHVVFDHLVRRSDRDAKLWNIAADYCVNGILVKERIGTLPTQVKPYHDTKYDGWSAEAVYDELYEKADKMDLDALGQLLDDHMDPQEGEGDEGGKRPKKLTEAELRALRDEIKEAVLEAAQAAGDQCPEEIKRMVKEMTESVISWKDLLQQQIQSKVRADFSFSRPNRKTQGSGIVLPGSNVEDTIDVCVAIDTSGSISNEQIAMFLSEIKGIMDAFKDYKIKVWCFDTDVHAFAEYDADSGEDIDSYEPGGGGGTEFMVNWDFMKQNEIEPKIFIMFTDMYPWGDNFGDPDYCQTIFINHGRPGFSAPFGMTAEFDAQY